MQKSCMKEMRCCAYLIECTRVCACGCNKEVTQNHRFVTGHNTKGQIRSNETRQRMSIAQKRVQRHNYGVHNANWRGGRCQLVIKVCQQCGSDYQSTRSSASKFCSVACYNNAQKGCASWAKHLTSDSTKPNYDPRIGKGLFGKDNPMYGKTGNLNPATRLDVRKKISAANSGSKNGMWVDIETRKCSVCKNDFSVKATSKQLYCSSTCKHQTDVAMSAFARFWAAIETKSHICAHRKSASHSMSAFARLVLSERMKKHNPMKNPDTVKKVAATRIKHGTNAGDSLRRFWQTQRDTMIERLRQRMTHNNPMFDIDTRVRSLSAQSRHARPNKFERAFQDFLASHKLPFKYTGDRTFCITCSSKRVRNPDFIHTTKGVKLLIEIGSDWTHPSHTIEAMKHEYQLAGWTCLYFYDHYFYTSSSSILEEIRTALG